MQVEQVQFVVPVILNLNTSNQINKKVVLESVRERKWKKEQKKTKQYKITLL